MRRWLFTLAMLVIMLGMAGCGARSTIVLVPDPDGRVGEVVVGNDAGQRTLREANQSVRVDGPREKPGSVFTTSSAELERTFATVLAVQPLPPATYTLYFLEDSNELTTESLALLPQIQQTIQERGSTDIIVSGHTDTVGGREYNFRLSLERAKAVTGMLTQVGVPSTSITVTSHGKGNPLVKTPDGVAEPRNRRVEVVIR